MQLTSTATAHFDSMASRDLHMSLHYSQMESRSSQETLFVIFVAMAQAAALILGT